MSHDSASGVISFGNKTDNIDITWEKVGFEKNFNSVNQALEKIARGLGGTFVRNPTWLESSIAGIGKEIFVFSGDS